MSYYKGNKKACELYNNKVTDAEKYRGTTVNWAYLIEISGSYYIKKHPNYESENLIKVESLPKQNLII